MLINDLTTAGEGVGTIDGLKVFVFGALPGEDVEVKIEERKKRYAKAKLKKIVKPSKERVKPICPHFVTCGGCQIMHLSYPSQLKWKTQRVKGAIKRIGGIETDVAPCVASPKELGYRAKVHLHDGGFYKRSSHQIVPIDKCYIHNPVGETARQGNDAKDLIVRTSVDSGEVMQIVDGKADRKSITEILGDLKFKIRPKDFFQINPLQAVNLYIKAVELAQLTGVEKVIDAYCGVGGLALFAAKKAHHVHGIELVSSAIASAKENALINGVTNVTFECKKVEKLKADVIFLNPPRGGVHPEVLHHCSASRLIYISCDPATLARDLKILTERYTILEVCPFDLFPQTTHVETVVSLALR